MLIFIENIPMAYAWGSRDALPELLGTIPTGEPQAELWLGAHPDAPATVAKASSKGRTLIDLIESDPELYGVDGGALPFLLKVLAIGAPLSLQVHPSLAQAISGFAAEEAAGVPRDARERNYGDANHKPELLVALSDITALSGFRPLDDVRRELRALAAGCGSGSAAGDHSAGRLALEAIADRCSGDADQARKKLLEWSLDGGEEVRAVLAAIAEAVQASQALHSADAVDVVDAVDAAGSAEAVGSPHLRLGSRLDPIPDSRLDPAPDPHNAHAETPGIDPLRLTALAALIEAYPADPGIFVSLLLHLVHLKPGEAVYLGARQLHAYLSGIGVEVMAASDNVLRAGLTQKYVDVEEVKRIVDLGELETPRIDAQHCGRGLVSWEPDIPDFKLIRARLRGPEETDFPGESPLARDEEVAELVRIEVPYPVVLITTSGHVRVERRDTEFDEVARVRRGQSLYISAGGAIELSGTGEVFLATVGRAWPSVSQHSTIS